MSTETTHDPAGAAWRLEEKAHQRALEHGVKLGAAEAILADAVRRLRTFDSAAADAILERATEAGLEVEMPPAAKAETATETEDAGDLYSYESDAWLRAATAAEVAASAAAPPSPEGYGIIEIDGERCYALR